MLLSTTNEPSGYEISDYKGLVFGRAILGTGLATGLVSQVSELTGQRSGMFERKIDSARTSAIEDLARAARSRGANGVIGVRVDTEELSSTGTGLLMVTAVGTAVSMVRTRPPRSPARGNESPAAGSVPSSLVADREKRRDLLERLSNGDFANTQLIADIGDLGVIEALPTLLVQCGELNRSYRNLTNARSGATGTRRDKLEVACKEAARQRREFTDQLGQVLDSMPREAVMETLYGGMRRSSHEATVAIKYIEILDLFDAEKIVALLAAESVDVRERALRIASTQPGAYTAETADQLAAIAKIIDQMEFVSAPTTTIKKLIGVRTVWTCVCGTEVKAEANHCPACKRNSAGQSSNAVSGAEVAATLRRRAEMVREILAQGAGVNVAVSPSPPLDGLPVEDTWLEYAKEYLAVGIEGQAKSRRQLEPAQRDHLDRALWHLDIETGQTG